MRWMERRSSMALPSWRTRHGMARHTAGLAASGYDPGRIRRGQERLLGLDAAVALRCHAPSAGMGQERVHTISAPLGP